ncbi:toxin TcdB middle/N-terminal domain-containing protein, partial [Alteromonas sp. a30]|uniref:toxin TcdB middle/N-terminal domain-containing protein n=1 Tax=Alteromonas sp. a30 TaxID=2730917 RepID=UPI002282FFD3
HFVESSTGSISITEQTTDIIGSASGSIVVDAFGKGLEDVIFVYGGCDTSACGFSDPVSGSMLEGKALNHVYINKNYGAANSVVGAGDAISETDYQPVDMLKGVNNGVGLQSQWTHRPLSSDEYDSAHASFYQTNFTDVVDGLSRGTQIHFASSMYAVAQFSQSSGVGSGASSFNTTQYQYDGAVYDILGRGFRGFNGITEIDLANGTTTYTDFKQSFPFSSAIEQQFRFEGTNV